MGVAGSQGHIVMLRDPQNNWDLLRPPRTRVSIRLRTIVGKEMEKTQILFSAGNIIQGRA